MQRYGRIDRGKPHGIRIENIACAAKHDGRRQAVLRGEQGADARIIHCGIVCPKSARRTQKFDRQGRIDALDGGLIVAFDREIKPG